MNKCLFTKLNSEVTENLPFPDGLRIELRKAIGGVFTMAIASSGKYSEIYVDGVLVSKELNNNGAEVHLDDGPHIVDVKNLSDLTGVNLYSKGVDYILNRFFKLDIAVFKNTTKLGTLNLDIIGRTYARSSIYGDIVNLKNFISNLKTLRIQGSDELYGDISIFKDAVKLNTILLKGKNFYGDLDNISPTIKAMGVIPEHVSFLCSKFTCSGNRIGNTNYAISSIPNTIADETWRIDFKSSKDVDNFIIAQSECVFGERTSAILELFVEEDYTPSEVVKQAIVNLKTNMYAKLGDSSKTQGTYYTSVKVNDVEIQ